MTTNDLVQYYANLLIIQYIGLPKAYATVEASVAPVLMPQTTIETVSFLTVPASGTFELVYDSTATAAINWNDSASTIQTKLQAITGLGSITVSGSIASELLTITFTGVIPPAAILATQSNNLTDSLGHPVPITINEIDQTLPLAAQNAFNLIGSNTAIGAQLDILGKYVGVTRAKNALSGPITLDDADFLTLIKLAIMINSAQSSLSAIQAIINFFFPNEMLVFDYQNMTMNYLVSTSVGSLNLVQIAILENLLPKPMGVELSLVIFAPNITKFFGFRTYSLAAFNASPFNSYADYTLDTPWLSYANAVTV